MRGLHLSVLDAALEEGIPLALGQPVPWLSGRGHLNSYVRDAPPDVLAALATMHSELGGNVSVLATKRPGTPPTPDLVHTEQHLLIEIDEVQHFTTARRRTLDNYPEGLRLGFNADECRLLIDQWSPKGDKAFAHKTSADFPRPGGRQAQRAYNDALRDLLAPHFTGKPLVRIAAPERSISIAMKRLK